MNIEYLWIDELFYYKQYKLSQCWNIWIEGKKTINFSSNMAGGYESGKSADLMFRVTTTMTIALNEDN